MRLLISAPSGFNTREILLPLAPLLAKDPTIERVTVATPAASYADTLFPPLGPKFTFTANAAGQDFSAVLEAEKPDAVITPTNGLDGHDVPILEAARRLNIPSFVFVASWDNVYKIERSIQYGRTVVRPDYFAVWNNMMQEHLLRLYPEISETTVRVIGVPRFDFFFSAKPVMAAAALRSALNIPSDDAPLFHCATTELYPFDYILRSIKRAAEDNRIVPAPHLFASVHPGGVLAKHENLRQYGATVQFTPGRREASPLPDFRYLPTYDEISLHVALFQQSNLLINHSSTVAIESMLADVPVINIKYGRPFDWWRWRRSMVYRDFHEHYREIIDYNGTSIVASPRELIAAIRQYLANPAFKRAERLATVKRLITFTDGASAKRLVDYIKEKISL